MKICVAPDLCCGAQLCVQVAPEFYKLAGGFNALVTQDEPLEVPPEMEAAARRGADACPESAIRIIDGDR